MNLKIPQAREDQGERQSLSQKLLSDEDGSLHAGARGEGGNQGRQHLQNKLKYVLLFHKITIFYFTQRHREHRGYK